ncbi:transporter substrate-binding domain-containing protein [Sphaerotilus sp.]|uniref:transporter substrate-binding domain-containing protein n=1 Tax=Sphaerotilus sp. TaxID=2093942 RepID=UPI0034E28C90
MRRRLISGITLVVVVTGGALALIDRTAPGLRPGGGQDGDVLRVGYALEAPYAFLDAQGHLQGEAIDTLRAALQRLGLPEPVWVHVEFPRLIHELRSGRIDVIAAGLFITPERATQVEFTRPTTSVRPGLLVTAGNPLGLHALGDLQRTSGARLAVLDGSVEWTQAREAGIPEAQLLRVPDPAGALAAMRSGQAVAFALSTPSLRWILRESPDTLALATPFEVPRRAGQPDIGYPAYAFRRGDPMRERIDLALSGYLGSAEHLQTVAGYGFSVDDIATAYGMVPAAPSTGASR